MIEDVLRKYANRSKTSAVAIDVTALHEAADEIIKLRDMLDYSQKTAIVLSGELIKRNDLELRVARSKIGLR